MSFIQLVEGHSSRFDDLNALDLEWEKATEGKRTARRSILTKDRNDPTRFVTIVFFDSYESAMENSQMPETTELAGRLQALVDGPLVFHDLDVVDDRD